MKRAIRSLLASLVLAATATIAMAAAFPERPIHVVVGFASGVGMEVNTRILADQITKATALQSGLHNPSKCTS